MSQHAGIYIREANGEILICIGRNAPTKLAALEEADRMLRKQILLEQNKTGGGRTNELQEES